MKSSQAKTKASPERNVPVMRLSDKFSSRRCKEKTEEEV